MRSASHQLAIRIGIAMRSVFRPFLQPVREEPDFGLNGSRKDSKFSQIARNLKSHKVRKSNFIYQGYAEDAPGGVKITDKGMEFVELLQGVTRLIPRRVK